MSTRIEAPAPRPIQTDIELFAKAYFNIELTSQQLEMIAMVAAGKQLNELRISRRHGRETANKVIRAYLQEGLNVNGRTRLPQHPLPPREKIKGVTKTGKVLALIARPQGAYNFELSRYALKYTSVISDLRRQGHNIPPAERQYLKNGRASNTYRYRLVGR